MEAEKAERCVSCSTGQAGKGVRAVAIEDCMAEGKTVLKRKRPEHIYILCGGNK